MKHDRSGGAGGRCLVLAIGLAFSADSASTNAAGSEHPCAAKAPATANARDDGKPVRRNNGTDYYHDQFTEDAPPGTYRLPVYGQVLVPREGQAALNGPNHEGVSPGAGDAARARSAGI